MSLYEIGDFVVSAMFVVALVLLLIDNGIGLVRRIRGRKL